MAQIGATLKALRRKLQDTIEEDDVIPPAATMAAFDRATNDLLTEIVDGVTEEPAKPKQPRKTRGPNKKNKPGIETDSGATD